MARWIFTFLICQSALNGICQTMQVLNKENEPVAGAVITISDLHQTVSKTMISDNQGEAKFHADIPPPVLLNISMMGFASIKDTLTDISQINRKVQLSPAATALGEVTVTGNYTGGYQGNSVYKIDVLGQKEIQNRAANDLKDLLGKEVNMNVQYNSATGSGLSIMGAGGEQVKFLVDGVPVVGRIDGQIDLAQLNLSNIERVEVVKGPMAVLYGSNASGGVINLITRKPTGNKWAATLNTYYETTGQYNADASLSKGFKNSSFSVTGGRYYFQGWDENDTSRYQLWKPREQYFGSASYRHTYRQWKFGLQANLLKEKITDRSFPVITPYSATGTDNIYNTTRSTGQFDAERKFSEHSSFKASVAYTMYRHLKNTYRKNLVDLTEQLTPDNADDDTTNYNSWFSRINYNHDSRNGRWSFLAGSEITTESANGKRIDGNTHRYEDAALLAAVDYKPLSVITIRPSIRVIYNSQFNAPLVPAINLMYKPSSELTVRASWSKGFRAPSLKEQYLYFVDGGIHNVQGNPNLKAENSSGFLLSATYQKSLLNAVVSFEPSLFYTKITDRISLALVNNATGLYTYVNLDEFTSRGGEVKARISRNNFSISTGVAYTGISSTFNEASVVQPVSWATELNTSGDFTVKKTKTTFSAICKYQGRRPVYILQSDNSLQRSENGDFILMDVIVKQPFISNHIVISAGVKNIMNVITVSSGSQEGIHSSGNGSMPVGMGRSFFTKVSLIL